MEISRGWFLADPARTPGELPSQGWREIALPHQWSLEGIEAEVGWYMLDIENVGQRRWVRLLADYRCELWADGGYIGEHEGYFEPWTVEVPCCSTLLVRVEAPREPVGPAAWPRLKTQVKGIFGQHDCRPGGMSDAGQERGTGGLWGGARVWSTGPLALLHLGWQAAETADGWTLTLLLELDSEVATHADIEMQLGPETFEGASHHTSRGISVAPGRQTIALIWDLPQLERWEVWERGTPNLYRLELLLGDQRCETPIGLRTIRADGPWLVLNGRRLFLRGTNIIPAEWLASYDEAQARRDVDLLREANLNAVRVHAHLTHPAFYDACDRAGILVWQDFPLQWGYSTAESFAQEALRQIPAMVATYGHHPSIYLWCAHNEPTHNRHTLAPLLARALAQADQTRIIREASDFREHPYPGWYWGHMRDFLALPGGPVPTEFGAQALPSPDLLRRTLGDAAWPPRWETWVYHNFQPDQTFAVAGLTMGESLEQFVERSQLYQAQLLRFAIEAYRRAKGRVAGYFQFMFVDPWPAITWSVIDVERRPKLGYAALRDASSPVLLSIVPMRETLDLGQPPVREIWLINDLERPLKARILLRLEGPQHVELGQIDVTLAAGEARRCFSLGESWERPITADGSAPLLSSGPELIAPGTYTLVGEAWEGRTLLSRSTLPLHYVEPLVPPLRGW